MKSSETNGDGVRKKDSKSKFRSGESDLDKGSIRKRLVAGGGGGGGAETDSEEVEGYGSDDSFLSDINRGGDIGRKAAMNGGDRSEREHWTRDMAPIHIEVRESPLSSDSILDQSHAGLFNLCIVLLVAVNSRLIIENLMKYGLLMKSGFWFSSTTIRDWPLLMCCLSLPLFPIAAFFVEILVHKKYISELVSAFLHVILSTATVLYPIFVILSYDSAVISGVTLMLFACTNWLKLISYAHSSYDLRSKAKLALEGKAKNSTLSKYGTYNVSFKSLAYFIVAPTLCYQPEYPRTDHIRKGWIVRQVVKLLVFTGLMGFIIEQYINPIVKNSQHPLKGDLWYCIERILKLSVPNLYVWLCMFYVFFHLWLNILAELLRFGDRQFYQAWWNAETIEEYWKLWNKPVHNWLVRHIYMPCVRRGMRKEAAILVVFFFSAIFHELCIAVPCHLFKFWAFSGIMLQVPFVMLTRVLKKRFKNTKAGNMLFWLFFCILGQPMCLLLYYHDVMNQKGNIEE